MTGVVPLPGSQKPPKAPRELTADQAAIWDSVVGNLPPGWFGKETHALLVQYCRHASRADQIARVIERMEEAEVPDPRAYAQLLSREHQQSQVMATLATKMRISQQSTYDKKSKKTSLSSSKLWES